MPRVAIVGSCITRDLWPIRGGGAETLAYVSRTSLPGLVSPPVAGFRPAREPPAPLRLHQHNALLADLRKTALERLMAFRPTHLIFDLIDERFDLISVGDAIVSHTWELEVSGYLEQKAFRARRPIPRLSAACSRLWHEAAAEIAAIVRGTPLREATLILHVSRWAHAQRTPQGVRPLEGAALLDGQPVDIAEHNALLAAYEARFVEVMPPMARLDAGALRLADPGHHWGLSPYHFVPEYYAEIWRQLEPLGVPAPASARPAAPSVPAA
ncbi:hypothetical protein PHZ_c0487 [Phenylobacterium zucineum HLK1]|uniref:Uncharacterized protein n=1 Tax=Phenylobacterium zucineum (strain HLK1) TaxID=450851 RepID=B4REF9_PHEZH|nr:DUF6270 domain-containing protein [Phenylobacterium zucineum]ACG76901.1 hypothetical protein PHZ_c0487 [Phenylobacterium zucineum HLK1]